MPRLIQPMTLFTALLIVTIILPVSVAGGSDSDAFRNWLSEFKERARESGISDTTLNNHLDGLRPDTKILQEDDNQTEFTTPFPEYRGYFVTPEMVEKGRSLASKHESLLNDLEGQYGVPGEILVAIWGIESRYGTHTSRHPAMTALASLAYKQDRRGNYFEDELMTLLRLVERDEISSDRLEGSWAGALGQPQFMPSSYKQYAVDFDGDGRRNIWESTPDILGSIAHYLAENGWQAGKPWVRTLEGDPVSNNQKRVMKPDSATTAYRVFGNFDILLRYNQSNHYGLTVGILANKIKRN